jgi:histidine ammonia-lyase
MVAEVTTAALMSENKHLANPCSTDSTPTSANQEDHVSMAAYAARRLERMNRNLSTIIGVELMCAAQGIEFRAPLKTSPSLAKAVKEIRAVIPTLKEDRYQADDIARASELVSKGSLVSQLGIDGYVVGVTS